jgi:hypothetical protein
VQEYHSHLIRIKEMPQYEIPEVFGLNTNAEITTKTAETESLLKTLNSLGEIQGVTKIKGQSLRYISDNSQLKSVAVDWYAVVND